MTELAKHILLRQDPCLVLAGLMVAAAGVFLVLALRINRPRDRRHP